MASSYRFNTKFNCHYQVGNFVQRKELGKEHRYTGIFIGRLRASWRSYTEERERAM